MPIYNGVGAYWMPRWMRDAVTRWFIRDFTEDAAEDHDLAYWLGCVSRFEADTVFLAAMLSEATTPRTTIKAWIIYAMVRAFGARSYNRTARGIP
jgi:hypothetical protein